MATSKELALDIMSTTQELSTELDTWVTKGRKISAKRARKITLKLASMFKDFRHMSVAESKESADDTEE
jgi:Holliday junction resolvasome RuvABC DNA-binding subunit